MAPTFSPNFHTARGIGSEGPQSKGDSRHSQHLFRGCRRQIDTDASPIKEFPVWVRRQPGEQTHVSQRDSPSGSCGGPGQGPLTQHNAPPTTKKKQKQKTKTYSKRL